MAKMTDLDYLLIGKTGSGKSRTGNSILKRDLFVHKTSTTSVTKRIQSEVSEYKGRIIKVVDCPGVGDTRLDDEEAVKRVVEAVAEAININPSGYHAFLLVVRFGGRFTKEDTDTVQLLKNVFGEDFVKNFCILVMTCGDVFQAEDSEETFQEWCQSQKGVFKQLLDECQGRIVLFNNVTRSEGEKDAQNDRLHEIADNIASKQPKFCNVHFEKAKEAREKAMVETRKPVLQEKTCEKLSLISQEMEKVLKNENPEKQIGELQKLFGKTEAIICEIKDEDKGTGALKEILTSVETMQASIREAIHVLQKVNNEKAALKQREDEMKKNLKEQLKEQKKNFEKTLKQEKEDRDRKEKAAKEAEDKKREEMEKKFTRELELMREKLKDATIDVEIQRKRAQNESVRTWMGVAESATNIGLALFTAYQSRKSS